MILRSAIFAATVLLVTPAAFACPASSLISQVEGLPACAALECQEACQETETGYEVFGDRMFIINNCESELQFDASGCPDCAEESTVVQPGETKVLVFDERWSNDVGPDEPPYDLTLDWTAGAEQGVVTIRAYPEVNICDDLGTDAGSDTSDIDSDSTKDDPGCSTAPGGSLSSVLLGLVACLVPRRRRRARS